MRYLQISLTFESPSNWSGGWGFQGRAKWPLNDRVQTFSSLQTVADAKREVPFRGQLFFISHGNHLLGKCNPFVNLRGNNGKRSYVSLISSGRQSEVNCFLFWRGFWCLWLDVTNAMASSKRSKKEKIQFLVAVRSSKTPVLKFPIVCLTSMTSYGCR